MAANLRPFPAAFGATHRHSPAVRDKPCPVPGLELPDGVREYLLAAGASEEEIDRVMDDDALFTLAGDLVRRRDIEWIPIENVAATAGVSVEDVERYRPSSAFLATTTSYPRWTVCSRSGSYRTAASLVGDEVTRA